MALNPRTTSRVLAVWICVVMPVPAHAIVQTIDAQVTAEVEEHENEAVTNSDLAFEDLDDTTSNLPLFVEAALSRNEEGEEVSAAAASTTFSDPRLSDVPDPDEFGIDVAMYSRASNISYTARSAAQETREIQFLESEIGAPSFSTLEAQSEFFVDGILLIWGELGTTDLTGTSAEVIVSVEQLGSGSVATENVLSATVLVEGNSDGTVSVTATGALSTDNLIVVDLTGDIPDFGPTHLVIIQNTAIPYVYPATVGETFSLTASIEGNVENQPGTGGSIELGVPLVELIGLINDVTGGGVGDLFGDILDQAKGNAGDPLRPLTPSGQGTQVTVVSTPILGGLIPAGLCGMLGIESLLMTMMLCVGVGLMTRRRSS